MAGNKVKIDIVVDAKKGSKEVKKFGKDTEQSMKKASTGMKGLSTAVKAGAVAFAALVAVKVVDWLKDQFTAMADLADALAKTAVNLGITTVELEQMRFVAELSGISITEMDKALFNFNRQLGEAFDNTGPAADALAQLGLSAEELSRIPLPEAIARIAESYNKLGSAAEKAMVRFNLFGKAGNKMEVLFKQGPAAIRKYANELLYLGGITSTEGTEKAQEYNDAILRLGKAWHGFKQEALPILAEVGAAMASFGTKHILYWSGIFSTDPIKKARLEILKYERDIATIEAGIGVLQDALDTARAREKGSPSFLDIFLGITGKAGVEGALKNRTKQMEDAITGQLKKMNELIKKGEEAQKQLNLTLGIEGPGAPKFGGGFEKGAPVADPAAAAAEKAAMDAINNSFKIRIGLMTDERDQAGALLQYKIVLIEEELAAKEAKHGREAVFIEEAHMKELQAKQEHAATIRTLDEEEMEQRREREEAWLAKQQEIEEARSEMRAEGVEDYRMHQEQIKEIQGQRNEAVWIDMETELARTGRFYQDKLEQARAAGATEMELEKIKTNMKKDLAMSGLQTTMEVARQFAAQSKNAWRAYKAAAIAQTIISTFKSAQSSYEALAWIPLVGPALGIAAAGAALIAGFARVQSIRKQERPSAAEGGIVTGPSAGFPATLHGTEAIVPLPNGKAIPVDLGGGAGGGTLNVNIQAVDSQSIVDLMARNPQAVLGPMIEQMQLGDRNLITTIQNTTREE